MAVQASKQSSTGKIVYFNSTLTYGKKSVLFDDIKNSQGESIKEYDEGLRVDFADLPEFPKIAPSQEGSVKLPFRVSAGYDAENQKITHINPFSGVFEAVPSDIGPRPEANAEPHSKEVEKQGNDGKAYTDKSFYVEFEIVEKMEAKGFFNGVHVRRYLKDKFFARPDGMVNVSGTSKSVHTNNLLETGEMIWGFSADDIPMPEDNNLLPTLLEIQKENPVPVRLTVKNGFIDSLLPSTLQYQEVSTPDDFEATAVRRPKVSGTDEEL
jgi:hypothetical protein